MVVKTPLLDKREIRFIGIHDRSTKRWFHVLDNIGLASGHFLRHRAAVDDDIRVAVVAVIRVGRRICWRGRYNADVILVIGRNRDAQVTVLRDIVAVPGKSVELIIDADIGDRAVGRVWHVHREDIFPDAMSSQMEPMWIQGGKLVEQAFAESMAGDGTSTATDDDGGE